MILIDYSGIALANIQAQKLPPEENLLRHMILNSIRMYRKKYRAKYGEIVICCDSPNNWRRNAFKYYKAKRREAREEDTGGMNWDLVFEIMGKVREELRENFPYKVLQVEGAEADDIIGILTRYTQEFGKYEPVMIVSSDKDFVQLQKYDNVSQYSPMRKKLLVESSPDAYLTEHILRGDAGDGIPNVLSDDDTFVVEGKRQARLTAKKLKALMDPESDLFNEFRHNIARNTRLISLEQTPKSLQQETINKFEDESQASDGQKVLNYLIANKCKLLIDDIEDFI